MNNTAELLSIVHTDEEPIGCNVVVRCPYQERSLSYATGVDIPEPGQTPEEIFKECCYTHMIFADLGSTNDFKNDYSGFYHQRQLSNETVNFFLYRFENDTEYALTDGTYGQFFGFGFFDVNIDLKGYLVEWKKVLTVLGEGNYKIIKRITVAGVPVEFESFVFTLKQFSEKLADKTARIDVVMNGRLVKTGVDFTGVGWKHSLRVPGFFGRRDPQLEEDNLITRDYEKRQISMKQVNEYKFQTNKVPSCITDEIWDFLLFANHIYMNDYNLNNHSYDFVKFGVKWSSNEGTEYTSRSRKATINLTFTDKFENNIKRNYI